MNETSLKERNVTIVLQRITINLKNFGHGSLKENQSQVMQWELK